MPTLPAACARAILAFAPLFSKRVFTQVQMLLLGAILAPAGRTVSSCLRVMGVAEQPQFQRYHRVLNRARWSALKAGRILLGLVLEHLLADGPVVFGLDDTIERRRGKHIAAKGVYRDPVRSSHGHFVKATGLRWLSLMLLTELPWTQRRWALPVLTMLAPSEGYHQQRGRPHKKLTDWARQGILQLRRWLPDRPIIVVADSGFAVLELLDSVGSAVTMITRLRLDAALYDPPPVRVAGQRGRPRKRGARLPKLSALLADTSQSWSRVVLRRWYSQKDRCVEVLSGTGIWSSSGSAVVAIRWVLVRDPAGRFNAQAFLSTDLQISPEQILSYYVDRWQMEVSFSEVRQHLGVESQRQWSDQAIARTTPVLLGLYSLVTLMANDLYQHSGLLKRTTAWYVKEQYCFSDAIASVRNQIWQQDILQVSGETIEMVKIPRRWLQRCLATLCYAS